MRLLRTLVACVAVAIPIAIAACGSSDYSYSCTGGQCKVDFHGEQVIDLTDLFGPRANVDLMEFRDGEVDVAVGGQMGTLTVGETANVGELELNLTRLDGSEGNLEVRRTG
jgi:hypothetical protein